MSAPFEQEMQPMQRHRTLACLAAALLWAGFAPTYAQGSKSITACELFSPAEIRRITGRTDVATKPTGERKSGSH